MLNETSFSFNSDLNTKSNPAFGLEFRRKVFQIEVHLHEKMKLQVQLYFSCGTRDTYNI